VNKIQFNQNPPRLIALVLFGLVMAICPIIGESFRGFSLPAPLFVIIAIFCGAFYIGKFYQFFIENKFFCAIFLMTCLYCAVSIFLFKNRPYWILIDLLPIALVGLGFYLGVIFSKFITTKFFLKCIGFICLVLAIKALLVLVFQIPLVWDGSSFFSGVVDPGGNGNTRVILKGSSIFLCITFFISLYWIIGGKRDLMFSLIGWFILTACCLLLLLNGTRSILLGILAGLILATGFSRKEKKSFYFLVFLSIVIGVVILNLRSNEVDGSYPAISAISSIEAAKSVGVSYRLMEAQRIIDGVGGNYLFGNGIGSSFFFPQVGVGSEVEMNYAHSLPLWLYLKGGLFFLVLFYSLCASFLIRRYRYIAHIDRNDGMAIYFLAILASIIVVDIFTNQFATISGSFYLGLIGGFYPAENLE